MTQKQYKHCILILADGARPDVLFDLEAKGDLPNLSKEFKEKGTAKTMLSCFPSTTGPAYLPYVTGAFPGTCNVPGIRWFDKARYAKKGWGFGSFRSYCGLEADLFDSDMNQDIKTAWEIFPNSKSIYNGVRKGLPKKRDITSSTRTWHYYYAHLTDRWSYIDDKAYEHLKSQIQKKDFDFSFVVFPSVDEFSHRSSVFHDRVLQAYRHIDSLVGKIVQDLKAQGIYEDTLLGIVSDHGLSDTHSHFDVGPWLESHKNLKTFYYTNIFKFRFDAVSMISGNGMANLYFKNDKGWGERTSFEELSHKSLLLDELRFHEAVALVVTQGCDGSLHFQTDAGHGSFVVDKATMRIKYHFDKKDPLGVFVKSDPEIQKGMTFDEAMIKTFDSHFPDVFMQMFQLFHSGRTGDVVISANSGFDFRKKYEHPLHKASHGAICPEHMKIPFLFNHKLNADYIRSIDVFPTICDLMGKDIPKTSEGKNLAKIV